MKIKCLDKRHKSCPIYYIRQLIKYLVTSCGGIFRIHKSFVKGCYVRALSIGFAFEAELMVIIMAL